MSYTYLKNRRFWMIGGLISYLLLTILWITVRGAGAAQGDISDVRPADFTGPTYSSPIAMTADQSQIWVVSPDTDQVFVLDNLNNNPQVVRQFRVGDEPQGVALDDNGNAYVANAADNSVMVLNNNGFVGEVTTGSEPWNVVSSPDGERVFAANSVQDTISVINTTNRQVIGHIDLSDSACDLGDPERHFQPRGLAVTAANDRLYVTSFLAYTGGPNAKQGTDDGKLGYVCRIDIDTNSTDIADYQVIERIALGPQDTGFADVGDNPTAAFPNQLQSVVLCGNQAYLPNIAASPLRPLRFNTDTQAFVNVIDNAAQGDPVDDSAAKFLNLHLGARDPEPGKTKLFFANPWAIGFTENPAANEDCSGDAYVVSAGSDLLVKVNVNAGELNFTVDENTTRYIDLNDPSNPQTSGANAGKNPLGIVIRNIAANNKKAFVMNNISRNVSVVNLTNDTVEQVIPLADLPPANSKAEELHVGKEVFFSSRGVFDGGKVNRLSSEGWQNCASCHFNGWTDGVIWGFVPGPRKSIPMNSSFDPVDPTKQRCLNYSCVFDEVQDFEINVRNISGPGPLNGALDPNHGLLIGDDGNIDAAPSALNGFALPNAGRPQLTVTRPGSTTPWPALDAMTEWVRLSIRTPNGVLTADELAISGDTTGGLDPNDVAEGRQLFFEAGCQTCHGGTNWTNSVLDFTPPPAAADIFTESDPNGPEDRPNPSPVQYLDRFLIDIDSFNLNVDGSNQIPGAPQIGAEEFDTAGRDGLGKDHDGDGQGDGFNTPSLLGIWHLPPYYHNGACETLACVLANETHRKSGNEADPIGDNATRQSQVVEFLKTIDEETGPGVNLYIDPHDIFIDPPTVFQGAEVTVGANVSLFGTIADLEQLLGNDAITVKFDAPGSLDPVEVTINADDFNQDFGQAIAETTWTTPANEFLVELTVEVDSEDIIHEDNEDDNIATRQVLLEEAPNDTTPPVVNDVFISDDDPFNDNDPVAVNPDVRVTILAEDPEGEGGEQASGLESYCVVGYRYDSARRRWVAQECDEFTPLPAPENDGSFIVDAEIPDRAGVAYVFVWVRDAAGNISKLPGFDFISVIPDEPIELTRNRFLVLRLIVENGQQLQLDFEHEFGDVDVSVFNGLGRNATRCAVSAQNGTETETVAFPSETCTGQIFQVEVRAFETSRFSINTTQGLNAAQLAEAAGDKIDPAKADLPTTPIVSGPPALRTAIGLPGQVQDAPGTDVYLPIIRR